MLESTDQMPQGLYQPNVHNKHTFGLFDECLAIRAKNEKTSTTFRGRYCTIYFRPTLAVLGNNLGLQPLQNTSRNRIRIIQDLGLFKLAPSVPQVADSVYDDHVLSRSSSFCLPSSCTAIDVRKAIADLIGGFGIADAHNETFVSILTATDDNQCYVDSDEPTEFDGANYAFL